MGVLLYKELPASQPTCLCKDRKIKVASGYVRDREPERDKNALYIYFLSLSLSLSFPEEISIVKDI